MRQKISATLITKNEASNLERTLAALDFVDEIVIADSFSTDETKAIAEKFGAKIFDHPFKNYGTQKNVVEAQAAGPWILNIDADEVVSPELKQSILALLECAPESVAPVYQVHRLNFVENMPIRHGGWNKDIIPRLYQKGRAYWSEPNVHERLTPTENHKASMPVLSGALNHYSFSSLRDQVITNMRYAEQGARDLIERKRRPPFLIEILLKPIGKFLECYIVKAGFLDGRLGLYIALNAAHSIFMKYVIASRMRR